MTKERIIQRLVSLGFEADDEGVSCYSHCQKASYCLIINGLSFDFLVFDVIQVLNKYLYLGNENKIVIKLDEIKTIEIKDLVL